MKIYIEFDENDQTIYHNTDDPDHASAIVDRLIRDDDVTAIRIKKIERPEGRERNHE